jgi:hypothetical protein
MLNNGAQGIGIDFRYREGHIVREEMYGCGTKMFPANFDLATLGASTTSAGQEATKGMQGAAGDMETSRQGRLNRHIPILTATEKRLPRSSIIFGRPLGVLSRAPH